MSNLAIKDFFKDQRAEERRRDLERITLLMQAYYAGDVDAFRHNMTADLFPWTLALRKLAKLTSVSPEMQYAFGDAWVRHKHLSFAVNNHSLLCAAARVMLPAYTGPAVRLFRGASTIESRRRSYGLSWTEYLAEAERFAEERQEWPGGSVVFETVAPPAAIICKMPYPEPFTEEERVEMPSGVHFEDFYEEQEYVIDRRQLTQVTVVRRLHG
jgi:hypothetical protein